MPEIDIDQFVLNNIDENGVITPTLTKTLVSNNPLGFFDRFRMFLGQNYANSDIAADVVAQMWETAPGEAGNLMHFPFLPKGKSPLTDIYYGLQSATGDYFEGEPFYYLLKLRHSQLTEQKTAAQMERAPGTSTIVEEVLPLEEIEQAIDKLKTGSRPQYIVMALLVLGFAVIAYYIIKENKS